jgi:hypothetical protein
VKCTPFSPPTTAISSEKNNLPSLHLQDLTEVSATIMNTWAIDTLKVISTFPTVDAK